MPVLVVFWCLRSIFWNPYCLLSRNAPAGRDFVGQKQFSCQKHPTAEAVFLLGEMKIFRKIFSNPFNQQRSFFNFCTFLLQLQLCLLHTLYLLRNRHISVIHLAYSWHPRVLSPFATFSLLPGRIHLDPATRHQCIGLSFSDPARPMLAKQK